jgi:hypothetical protein
MDIGGCGRHGMNQLGLAIHPNMDLHAKMPLVPLLGLMHLGIPLLLAILRRTRRADDRGVDNGASAYLQPLRRQRLPDPSKALLAQLVRFQEMPELADRGLIGHGLAAQINPDELSHGL